ncbi:MAG: diaminopimelate epimerase, partial [Pyrinomonadaceae bacterium]
MRFVKFHGFGNDYIVFEAAQIASVASAGDFAKRVCDRHYGAGADGVAVVDPSDDEDADFNVRIFNADGTEAGLSGNGTRSAAAYLYYRDLWSGEQLRLATRTGVKLYRLCERIGKGSFIFEAELGRPRFDSASIPMSTDGDSERVVDYPLFVEGETLNVTALQMGNPNCCVFVDDFEALDWRRFGRALESHGSFPERTNVVFVRLVDRHTIELRIWERGVGETLSSGTCACAAVVAASMKELTVRTVSVIMPGGNIAVNWRDDDEVVMTGRAEIVYSGEWLGALG